MCRLFFSTFPSVSRISRLKFLMALQKRLTISGNRWALLPGHKGEFIAAKSRGFPWPRFLYQILPAPGAGEINNLEHLIADKVPVGVVECFEVVDIKQGQRKGQAFILPAVPAFFIKWSRLRRLETCVSGSTKARFLQGADIFFKKNLDPVKGGLKLFKHHGSCLCCLPQWKGSRSQGGRCRTGKKAC